MSVNSSSSSSSTSSSSNRQGMKGKKKGVANKANRSLTTKFSNILVEPVGWEVENQAMGSEEKHQKKFDRFWGIDKDKADRLLEKQRMEKEDSWSRMLRMSHLDSEKQRRWDEEYYIKRLEESRAKTFEKETAMSRYLQKLASTDTPDDLMNYVWNNAPDNTRHPVALTASAMRMSTESMASIPMLPSAAMIQNEGTQSSMMIMPTMVSIHQDGLQQSKTLINDTAEPLKRINNESIVQKHTVENFDRKTEDIKELLTSTEAELSVNAMQPRHMENFDGHVNYKWDQELMLSLAFSYLDVGQKGYLTMENMYTLSNDTQIHSLLKFTVFWSIIKRKQWAFFESLFNHYYVELDMEEHPFGFGNASSISSSSYQSSGVALRGPAKRYSMYKVLERRDREVPSDSIKLADWMNAASHLSRQQTVPMRHVRSQEEQHAIEQNLQKNGGVAVPSYGTLFTSVSERECRLSRTLKAGDCIWALHNKGARWLPAVVERIYSGDDVVGAAARRDPQTESPRVNESPIPPRPLHNGGNYFCDLWYPLNERDLMQARSETASRQLMVKTKNTSNGAHEPKPFVSERHTCSYAFDLVDSIGEGIVELNKLIWNFQSSEFRRIVETSLALSIIFGVGGLDMPDQASRPTSPAADDSLTAWIHPRFLQSVLDKVKAANAKRSLLDPEVVPCLLPVFVDTFSSDADDEDEELADELPKDLIRKSDFLEFCGAVVDVKKYSIVAPPQ